MEHSEYLKNKIQSNRLFMKSAFAEDEYESDQQKQITQPPLTKPAMSSQAILLTKDFSDVMKETNYLTLVQERKSHRVYKK